MCVILSLLGKPGAMKPRSVKQIALGWRLKTSGYLGPPKGHNVAASIWCLSGSVLLGINYLVGELLISSAWCEWISWMDVFRQAHFEVHSKKFALSSCFVWFCCDSMLVILAQWCIIVSWTCRFQWDFRWEMFRAYFRLWNCPQMNFIESYWWQVNIGSGDGSEVWQHTHTHSSLSCNLDPKEHLLL